MFKPFVAMTVAVLWFSVLGVSAQNTPMARGRVAEIIADAPPLQTFLNGNPVGSLIQPGDLTDYLSIPAGTYAVAFALDGKDARATITGKFSAVAEAGHDYTIALVGSIAGKDAKAILIDDTAALSRIDPATETVVTIVHNIKGAPAVSVEFSGKTVVDSLAYGEYAQAVVPLGAVTEAQFAEVGKPDNVLLAPPFFTSFDAHVIWFLGMYGTYPGQRFKDYGLLPVPSFSGKITTRDKGNIQVGTPVEGDIANGERAQYHLTLDADSKLDLTVAATGATLDSFLRVYDAKGTLIVQNDELDPNDDTTDAGVAGIDLKAGSYVIEAGSWNDASHGDYKLSVNAAAAADATPDAAATASS